MSRLDDPRFRARALAVLAVLAGVAVLAVLVALYVTSQQGQDNAGAVHRTDRKAAVAKTLADVAKHRADTAATKATATKKTADRAVARTLTLTRIIVQKGIAVQGEHGLRGGPGPIGKPGPPGPQGEQGVVPFTISDVVASLPDSLTKTCGGSCIGPAGAAGADGKDATDVQVTEAVSAFCLAHDGCRGPAGADSVVPGPAGAAGADSQVPGATGPAGADGAQGPQGAPGVTTTIFVFCTAPGVPDPACP